MVEKFSKFLTEAADAQIVQGDVDEWKKLAAFMPAGRRQEQYIAALDLFWKSYQNKAIYNADFGENYSYGLSRGLEAAWEKVRYESASLEKLRDSKFADDSSGSGFHVNGIAKELRHWANLKDKYPEYYAFWYAVRKLPEFIKTLKTYVIKGRKPVERDPSLPPQFVKPMIPVDAKKKAIEFLTQAVDAIRQDYYKSMGESFSQQTDILIEGAKKHNFDRKAFMKEFAKSFALQMAEAAFAPNTSYRMDAKLEINPQKDAVIAKIAKQTVDSILHDFVLKNSDKLGHIFAKKSVIKDHKIIYNRVRLGNLENGMTFSFDDGSSFRIYSSTVVGYTARGAQFIKYPTRFTDVVMKDGSKMGMPSEEKMIKEF